MTRAFILIIAAAAFCTGIFFLWKLLFAKNVPTEPAATVTISGHTYPIEVARTLAQKSLGLARRDALPAGQGMIFPFDSKAKRTFTMQGMRFPLDIIWISGGTVVDIAKDLQPDSGALASAYRPVVPVDMVLEVNAGTSDKDGLKIGDQASVSYYE